MADILLLTHAARQAVQESHIRWHGLPAERTRCPNATSAWGHTIGCALARVACELYGGLASHIKTLSLQPCRTIPGAC